MSDNTGDLPLAAEFPAATKEEWRKLVEATLAGTPFEKLAARTYDDLRIEPLYARAAHARPVTGRATAAPWHIMQRIDLPDPAAANAEALHELANGAKGLVLVFPGAIGAHGFGVEASALARVLAGVHFDAGISIELDLSPQAKDAAHVLAGLVKQTGAAPASADIRFGFDPLGAITASGESPMPWRDIAPIFTGLVGELVGLGFRGPFAAADARVVHAAGGSEAQELAYALSVAAAYLRALEAGGMPLEDARRAVFFRLAADADQFMTMAKFRALRKLWARVEQACGLAPNAAFVAAETGWRMMTKRDPHVNILRATIAVFAAALGGANAITVVPFTAALGLPDRFARRVARNTQLILLEESNLAAVMDPAAGSGGIEDITEKLARAAWTLFQEVEAAGGVADALARGLVQQKVAKTHEAREAAVGRRTHALTGTSDYPLLEQGPAGGDLHVLADMPSQSTGKSGETAFEPLRPIRLAEPFERLREASDRVLAQTGLRPKIFLASLGTLAQFTARAAFAKNFFEAGGIEAITNEGFRNPEQMIAAFRACGAQLACLCSSDDVYAREAPEAAKALKGAGVRQLYLAGRPGRQGAELAQAGVDTFVHTGCDMLAILRATHGILGIK